MKKQDKYDEIEAMDIPQEAKNKLKDREVQKEYDKYERDEKPLPPPKPKQPAPKKMARGGSVKSSASKRGDGCCVKGKTRGKMS
jgi:hypothetical protein